MMVSQGRGGKKYSILHHDLDHLFGRWDENEFKQAMILFYETNNMYHIKRLFLDQYRFAVKNYFPQENI